MRLFKAAAIWLVILVCAVLNGVFREAVLLPAFGTPVAFVLSGMILCVCIVTVSLVLIGWLGLLDTQQAVRIGTIWVSLTLAFEFGFGRLVQHRGWPELLEAYTFKDGNIWPVVLVVTFLAPLLAVRIRARTLSR